VVCAVIDQMPSKLERARIEKELRKQRPNKLLIFVSPQACIWQFVAQNAHSKWITCEFNEPTDAYLFAQFLARLQFGLSQEQQLTLIDVLQQINQVTELPQNIMHTIDALHRADQILSNTVTQIQQIAENPNYPMQMGQQNNINHLQQQLDAWQQQSNYIMQLIQANPVYVVPLPNISLSTYNEQLLDAMYSRLTIEESWRHKDAIAFSYQKNIYQIETPSFRDIYRYILSDLAQKYGQFFIDRCQHMLTHGGIGIATQHGVFNTQSYTVGEYMFNTNLDADSIRRYIKKLYSEFFLPLHEFAVWVR